VHAEPRAEIPSAVEDLKILRQPDL